MRRSAKTVTVAALAAIAVSGASTLATAQRGGGVKVGELTCDISAGLGLIISSHKELTCMFTPAGGGQREVYTGSITKFGLDLGATSGGTLGWSVYAPTSKAIGALAGHYSGASAEATVGVGAGVNVLVGGSNRTITLQPLSVQGQTGINVAAGVTELDLRRAR
jgi:hypothetical protein